ncbi:MAG: glucose-6-phosphate isomerase, partial [Spirochaetota bacterium]
MKFRNLDRSIHYKMLKDTPVPEIKELLSPESVRSHNIDIALGLSFNYAARGVGKDIIELLGKLAEEQELLPKYQALVS